MDTKNQSAHTANQNKTKTENVQKENKYVMMEFPSPVTLKKQIELVDNEIDDISASIDALQRQLTRKRELKVRLLAMQQGALTKSIPTPLPRKLIPPPVSHMTKLFELLQAQTKDRPVISVLPLGGPPHYPEFKVIFTFRNKEYSSVCHNTKVGKETVAKFLFNKLIQCGDVESNPGPVQTSAITLGSVGVLNTSPLTVSLGTLPQGDYDVEMSITAGSLNSNMMGTFTLNGVVVLRFKAYTSGTIMYRFPLTATEDTPLSLVWSGTSSGTATGATCLIAKPQTTSAVQLVQLDPSSLPIWISEYQPKPPTTVTRISKKKTPTEPKAQPAVIKPAHLPKKPRQPKPKFSVYPTLLPPLNEKPKVHQAEPTSVFSPGPDIFNGVFGSDNPPVDQSDNHPRSTTVDIMLSGDVESNPGPPSKIPVRERCPTPPNFQGVDGDYDPYANGILASCHVPTVLQPLDPVIPSIVKPVPLTPKQPEPLPSQDLSMMVPSPPLESDDEGFECDNVIVEGPDSLICELRDLLLHRSKGSSDMAAYYSLVSKIYGVTLPTDNKFEALMTTTAFPVEVVLEDDDTDAPPAPRHSRQNSTSKPVLAVEMTEEEAMLASKKDQVHKNKKHGKDEEHKSTREDREKSYNAMVNRLIADLTAAPAKIVAFIDNKHYSKFLKRSIMNKIYGIDWEDKEDYDQYQLYAYDYFNCVHRDQTIITLLSIDPKLAKFNSLFDNSAASLAAARSHNVQMHATNGNIFIKKFQEIEQLSDGFSFLKPQDSILPHEDLTQLPNFLIDVPGTMNARSADLFNTDKLRANVISAANAISQNNVIPISNTCLLPRTYRPAAPGAPINVSTLLPYVTLQSSIFYANQLEPTELGKEMSLQIKNNATSNWRRDNTSLSGFNNFDVTTMNTNIVTTGLSMEAPLLKLDLTNSAVAYRVNHRYVPKSVFNAIDSFKVPVAQDSVLGMNDSPIATETCGGATAVFPFTGTAGTIAFHLTLQTVPPLRRSNAIFMGSGLLQSTWKPTEAISLTALKHAEYPSCLYTLTQATTDNATPAGNPANEIYVMMQSLIRVPGLTTIDIILPRRYSEQNPTNPGAAMGQAVVIPTTGSTVTTAYPAANTPLDICFVGNGGLVEHNLCEYLYSWGLDYDVSSISMYLSNLANQVGIADTLKAVHEMNVTLTQVNPLLIGAVNANNANLTPDTQAAADVALSNHQILPVVPGNWPQTAPLPSGYRINDCNITAYNKVMLNLAIAPDLAPEGSMMMPQHIGSVFCALWDRLLALRHTICHQVFYSIIGITKESWDTGFTNIEMKSIQRLLYDHFSTQNGRAMLLPSVNSKILDGLYTHLFDRQLQKVKVGIVNDIDVSAFGRFLPGSLNFAASTNLAGVPYTGLTPHLLPDVWLNLYCTNLPKHMASFPPVGQEDSTYGFHQNMIPYKLNGAVGPFEAKDNNWTNTYPLTSLPDVKSEVRWNLRLWALQPVRVIATFANGGLAQNFPANGAGLYQRATALDVNEVRAPGILASNTTSLAVMNSGGERIIVFLTPVAATPLIRACQRLAPLAFPCWQCNSITSTNTLNTSTDYVTEFQKTALAVMSNFHICAKSATREPSHSTTAQMIDPNTSIEFAPVSTDTPEPIN